MRAVNTGNTYNIYNDSVKLYDQLPAQCYEVCFHERRGFWLEKYADIEVNEKIYGVHQAKVDKVLSAFKRFDRNLGVILSGDKGIGKSLFSKLLAQRAIEQGLPLIIVNIYVPGMANYINSLNQEVMVLFDEFDKVFAGNNDNHAPQAEMLTLFDGISMGKKLFVVTCNSLRNLNDYLVNRPGRFHYHFSFNYPTEADIREYLTDKLGNNSEIDKVINFATKINLNYDCLRAIAFELSDGSSFEDAIADLNILHIEDQAYYFNLYFTDGSKLTTVCREDMFKTEETYLEFELPGAENWSDGLTIYYIPMMNKYDYNRGGTVFDAKDLRFEINKDFQSKDYDLKLYAIYQQWKDKKIDFMQVIRKSKDSLHYSLA